jgi:hypothetical protein
MRRTLLGSSAAMLALQVAALAAAAPVSPQGTSKGHRPTKAEKKAAKRARTPGVALPQNPEQKGGA